MIKPEKNVYVSEKNEVDNTWTENWTIANLKLMTEIRKSYAENKTVLSEYLNISEIKSPVLIYRYSKNICPDCITKDLDKLANLQSITGKDKILILPAFDGTRNDRVILANDLSRFNYKNIPNELLVIPYDSMFMIRPYYAVINQTENIEMIFFPQRNNQKLTDIYFSEIKRIINMQ
ncbi:MAG: hypothetical protein LBH60_05965 [Prevotellaceae bacterium]|jgi:hypothetical protein|nr:hypothetical protein [Prevotellaceae bacterium]